MFAQIAISTAARDVIVGLLELERLQPALDLHLADAHEYRAMLEQRLDAVGEMLASVRPLVECAKVGSASRRSQAA